MIDHIKRIIDLSVSRPKYPSSNIVANSNTPENTNKDFTYLDYEFGGYWNFNEGDKTFTDDLINTNQIMLISGNPVISANQYGHYKINLDNNSKHCNILSDIDLEDTNKMTWKIKISKFNEIKVSGVQTLIRKNKSIIPSDALQEWDFTIINGVLYCTIYESGGLNIGYFQAIVDYTFLPNIPYLIQVAIDLIDNIFLININGSSVDYTVSTGGNAKPISGLTALNANVSEVEVGYYSADNTWNGNFELEKLQILPSIALTNPEMTNEYNIFI